MSIDNTNELIYTFKEEVLINRNFFQKMLRSVTEYDSTRNKKCIELIMTHYSNLTPRLARTNLVLHALQQSDLEINLPRHPNKSDLYNLRDSIKDTDPRTSEEAWYRIHKLVYLDPSFDTVFVEMADILINIHMSLAHEVGGYTRSTTYTPRTKTFAQIDTKWLDFDNKVRILFVIIEYLRKTGTKKH